MIDTILKFLGPVATAVKELFGFFNSILAAFKKSPEQKAEDKISDRTKEIEHDVEKARDRSK